MWHQLLARLVRTSRVIDRGYLAFNRLRSRAVLALGGDRFFDAYNAIAYRDEPLHREGSGPRTLRAWECDFIRNLPPPPARILLGGAGTGREALAFAALGYQVVAFDSARPLVEEMQALAADQPAVEALLGGYQSLPVLHRLNGEEVDLAARLEFDATYVGWASLSHLRSDAECVSLFTRLAALTAGPILLSYLPGPDTVGARAGFSVQIGFYRQLSGEHVRRLAAEAGLDVLSLQPDENWPRAVLRRPRETTPESEG